MFGGVCLCARLHVCIASGFLSVCLFTTKHQPGPYPKAACSLTSMWGDERSEMSAGIACSEMTSFLKNICRGCSSESSGVAAMRGPGVKSAIARAASICVVLK